ncbi:NAD-dependent deacetylase [Tamaricihabitans halophyticus]|uniref:protein acetyllysine N-acetyltransferase n=1 Tax=Tamaricihabitans halophyticus TaxID=1262583 RepID=A0A4R2QPD2_9PSEU|nr:Sir2 family NAD-dependent protein deacetylase [Tamaricihabitans halophyticus]TCP50789.1 NAD-dependent deacetylase [Tamaricihabitans halophyticus]
MTACDADTQREIARTLLADARHIVVMSGAGISTDSGIPDFRGPNGVWTKNPAAERMSNLRSYLAEPDVRVQAWQSRLHHPAWQAKPNPAHEAIGQLERDGRLHAILTQNIDGLHQRAGTTPEKVLELHGTMFETECLSCGERDTMRAALDRVAAGETDPPCRTCGGILKSATISFGQELDQSVLHRASEAARDCDLLLAVGTSLTVQPAAGLVALAARAGADVVICNGAETPYDDLAAAVIREPLGTVLPALV